MVTTHVKRIDMFAQGTAHDISAGRDNTELINMIMSGMDVHSRNVNIAYKLGVDLDADPGAIKKKYNNLRDGIKRMTYASIKSMLTKY